MSMKNLAWIVFLPALVLAKISAPTNLSAQIVGPGNTGGGSVSTITGGVVGETVVGKSATALTNSTAFGPDAYAVGLADSDSDICAAITDTIGKYPGLSINARGYSAVGATLYCSAANANALIAAGGTVAQGAIYLPTATIVIDGPSGGATGHYTDNNAGTPSTTGTPAIIIPNQYWGLQGVSKSSTIIGFCTGAGAPIASCTQAFPQRSIALASSSLSTNTLTLTPTSGTITCGNATTPGNVYAGEWVEIVGSGTANNNVARKVQSCSAGSPGSFTISVPTTTSNCASTCGNAYFHTAIIGFGTSSTAYMPVGVSASFNEHVQDIGFNLQGYLGAVAIQNLNGQEVSGVNNIGCSGMVTGCLEVRDMASNSGPYSNLSITTSNNANTNPATWGIIHTSATRGINGFTISMVYGAGTQPNGCVYVDGGPTEFNTVSHVEGCIDGFVIAANATTNGLKVLGLLGQPSGNSGTNLVHIVKDGYAENFNNFQNLVQQPSGSTNCILDDINSQTITDAGCNYTIDINGNTVQAQGVPVDTSNPATLLVSDRANLLTWTSGTTLALPSTATAGFGQNFPFVLRNTEGATLTVTPSAAASNLCDGNLSCTILNNWASFFYSNGVNWYRDYHPMFASFPACADSGGNHLNFTTAGGFSCGTSTSGATSLNQVTGSAAQATATEIGVGDNWDYAGIETGALVAPLSFYNTNGGANATAALMIGAKGAGAAGMALLMYDVSGTGDIWRAYSGGSEANGTYTAGTLRANLTAAGFLNLGGTVPTAGTAGGVFCIEGTAPTGASTNYGIYCNSTDHSVHVVDQTADVGPILGNTSAVGNNQILKTNNTVGQEVVSSLTDNGTSVATAENIISGAAGGIPNVDKTIGFSPSAMSGQTSATCTNITNMTWNIAANKNYVLRCEIPMTLAATATIQYCLGGPGTATSYSLIAEGDLGTAGIWSQISTLAQTAYGTKTGASAAVAANTVQHVWAGIQNGSTASGTALTLQTAANGTNAITVGANATCTLTQIN